MFVFLLSVVCWWSIAPRIWEAWVQIPPEVQLFFFENRLSWGLCCVALSFFPSECLEYSYTLAVSLHSYGLLGSSGCGKTTLLRCILGRLNLASGYVTVLGKPPGSKGHHVPGRDVGYMPQVHVHVHIYILVH